MARVKVNDRLLKRSSRFQPGQGAFDRISPAAIAVGASNDPRRALSGPVEKHPCIPPVYPNDRLNRLDIPRHRDALHFQALDAPPLQPGFRQAAEADKQKGRAGQKKEPIRSAAYRETRDKKIAPRKTKMAPISPNAKAYKDQTDCGGRMVLLLVCSFL